MSIELGISNPKIIPHNIRTISKSNFQSKSTQTNTYPRIKMADKRDAHSSASYTGVAQEAGFGVVIKPSDAALAVSSGKSTQQDRLKRKQEREAREAAEKSSK
ncbi:hypothetical protein VCV18_005525 [Metarhizium anisopliae]